jgi:hypothetical protein
LIVLSNLEVNFLKQLTGLDVPVNQPYQDVINNAPSTPALQRIIDEIGNGEQEDIAASAASAYRSMLGFYNGKLSKLGHPGTDALIKYANTFVKQTGLKELPEIEMLTIKKMGLQNYVGLNVVYKPSSRLGASKGEYGRGRTGKSFDDRSGHGGRGGRGGRGRGDGGGAPRYMSTEARAVPTNRAAVNGESIRNQQSQVVHSPKKPRSESMTNDETVSDKPKRNRRRPNGRGGGGASNAGNE